MRAKKKNKKKLFKLKKDKKKWNGMENLLIITETTQSLAHI